MRQIDQDELVAIVASALRATNKPAIAKLLHHDAATALTARLLVAGSIASAMRRLEILTDAPEPPPFQWPDADIRLV